MKTFSSISGFLYLVLITITLLSKSLAFSLSFPRTQGKSPSILETQTTDHENDVLSEALSRAFPPSHGHNPAYVAALAVFRDLESKTSCHRTAAASLVSDCSTIEGKNDILKITYAAQLAVCEFEATGIKFPRECQSTDGSPLRETRVMECVRRLEERPQWWTTLSNNIQSAVVMCSAVRHEVEKDEILILHKNITKTQKSLFSALSTSLEEAWESITAQKSFGGIWKTTLNGVLEDLAETKGKVMDALRDAGANATGIIKNLTQELEVRREEQIRTVSELNQFILGAINKFEELGERSEKMTEVVETAMVDLSTDVNVKRGAIEQSLHLIHRISSQFYVDFNSSINNMLRTVDNLSTRIIDSSVKLETLANTFESHSSLFDSISSSYTELTKNHVTLTKSFAKQEETQQRLFSSLEKTHHRANVTFGNLLKMMDNLSQSLDQTSTTIHSWRANGSDWAGIPISSIMFISGILFAKGWEKVILVSLGALVMIAIIIFIGFVQFNGGGFLGMFGHGVFRKLPSAVEPFIGENLDNTGRVVSSSHWLWLGCFMVIVMAICGIFFFSLSRSRSMTLVKGFD